MPWSMDEGKPWLLERLCAHQPSSVLDVGAGAGIYANRLRPLLPGCTLVALEIYGPYVTDYQLGELYDRVIVGDARCVTWPSVDVVILGDVVEHMPLAHAEKLWAKARAAARLAVFVSLPIVEFPQGPVNGNAHEAHVHTWSHEQVMAMPGIVAGEAGEVIGVYEVAPARVTT